MGTKIQLHLHVPFSILLFFPLLPSFSRLSLTPSGSLLLLLFTRSPTHRLPYPYRTLDRTPTVPPPIKMYQQPAYNGQYPPYQAQYQPQSSCARVSLLIRSWGRRLFISHTSLHFAHTITRPLNPLRRLSSPILTIARNTVPPSVPLTVPPTVSPTIIPTVILPTVPSPFPESSDRDDDSRSDRRVLPPAHGPDPRRRLRVPSHRKLPYP